MQLISPALADEVDLRHAGLAIFRRIAVCLYFELLDCIDRGLYRHISELAGIVSGAVKRKIILIIAASDAIPAAVRIAGLTAGMRIARARDQRDELREIAAI